MNRASRRKAHKQPSAPAPAASPDGPAHELASLRALLQSRTLTAAALRAIAPRALHLGVGDEIEPVCRRLLEGAPLAAKLEIASAATAAGLHELGHETCAEAIEHAPPSVDLFLHLARSAASVKRHDDSLEAFARVLELDPDNYEALRQIGWQAHQIGKDADAVDFLARAIAQRPDDVDALTALGVALMRLERFEDAFVVLRQALELQPTFERALSAMAEVFQEVWDYETARTYRRLAAESGGADAVMTYLFSLLLSDQVDGAETAAEFRRFGGRLEAPPERRRKHANARDPDKRLTVAFMSGDLRAHSVARFARSLFHHLDRSQFRVLVVYTRRKTDLITDEFKRLSDDWLPAERMGDEAIADWLQARETDILIDLAGHTSHHRLPVFGLKPAPVQCTYLGYNGSTGLSTVDYRITTERYDPPHFQPFFVEKLAYLPGLFATPSPLPDMDAIRPQPRRGEPFAFACISSPKRMTATTIGMWAEILKRRPAAKLWIGNVESTTLQGHLLAALAQRGADVGQVQMLPRLDRSDFLRLHAEADLLLDTFPYGSFTTMHDALYLGIPAVCLEGEHVGSRSGSCVLREAGLDAFVARSAEEYVEIATAWFDRREELFALRETLRERAPAPKLESQIQHARDFGALLRELWREHCREAALAR